MADSDGKIVIGIEGDPSGINKSLDAVEKKGKEAASSIGSAFSAIAGALAGAKIVSAFQSAIAQAGKLEQSMLKVASTARSMGESTSKAQKAAMDLAQDGFLSASQAAQTLSNLMATGLNVDQAKKFITASKDITSFGNTIGNAAQATEDLSLGLLRGSALVIDNASPALKSLANKYQQLVDTQGKSAAALYAYNEITKTASKFQGDAARYMDTATGAQARYTAATDAASAAIGKSLQPALKGLYQTLTSMVEGFTKWFSGLNEGTQTILVMGVGLVALVPVISAVNGALALIALNPVTLTIMAIVGAMVALVAVMSQFNKSGADIVKAYKEQKTALEELGDKVKELEKTNKRTLDQEKELIDSKEKLRAKAKELGLNYDDLVKKLGSVEKALKAVDTAAKMSASKEISDKLAALKTAEERTAASPRLYKFAAAVVPGAAGLDPERFAKLAPEERTRLEKAAKEIWEEPVDAKKKADAPTGAKRTEQRFLESQEKLKEIELNRIATIAKAESIKDVDERKRRQMRAYEDAELLAKAEVNSLRSAYAEYIEDKAMADKLALDKQTDDAIRAVRLQEEAGELLKEQAEARIQKIREANARKAAQIGAQSVVNTLTAANNIVSAVRQGPAGAGGILSGAGELGGALQNMGIMARGGTSAKLLETAGLVGPFVGIATTLMSGISGLFGKSDEERAKEASEQKQRDEEAKALLELQANYQKSMLALQEAAAKLPFENLARQLRLVDIESQKQILAGGDVDAINKQRLSGRLSAMQGVLSSQGGVIGGGQLFGNVGSTPDELIKFLSDSAALRNVLGPLIGIGQGGGDYSAGKAGLIEQALQSLGYSGSYDNRLGAARQSLGLGLPGEQYDASGVTSKDKLAFAAYLEAVNPTNNLLEQLLSEFSTDTGIAENLLSVIEQSLQTQQEIAGSTKKTAENTSRLTKMNENNILDLVGGGIRGFGSFFRGAFNSVDSLVNPRMPALATPSAISSSLSVASLTRSWQDRAADGIENLVKIQTEALRLLAEIALNTDAQGQVQGSMTSAQLQDIMANIRSRIV
jgi:hypothetical protein